MPLSSAIFRKVSAVNGVFPSKQCRTMPSIKSPSVMFLYSASALSTFKTRRSIRTPVWMRSTSKVLGGPAMGASRVSGTNVPLYHGTKASGNTAASHQPSFDACHMGARVVTAWALPSPVLTVTSQWEAYAAAGPARFESTVVNVAHALADFTLLDAAPLARDLLVPNAAYRDLGLRPEDADPIFGAAAAISAEL